MRYVTHIGRQSYQLTDHCIERYVERVRSITHPTRDELERFSHELCFLLRKEGVVAYDPPEWVYETPVDEKPPSHDVAFYIVIGDSLAFPVARRPRRMILLTTLARGGMTHAQRERRNRKRQQQRSARSARRAFESWRGEKNPRWQ